MLPLYEAKMIHHYDTRWATYEPDGSVREVRFDEKADPNCFVMPRYWVHEFEVNKKLTGKWDKPWLLGWRDICRATDERTTIATKVPRVAFGDPVLLAMPGVTNERASGLQAVWSSLAFDFCSRQKVGGTHLKYFTFMQLPVPTPEQLSSVIPWIAARVDRLNARPSPNVDREAIRAELDALIFHVYGVTRSDVDYIIETFPILKRKNFAAYGEYRTKRLILSAYDHLTAGAHGVA